MPMMTSQIFKFVNSSSTKHEHIVRRGLITLFYEDPSPLYPLLATALLFPWQIM